MPVSRSPVVGEVSSLEFMKHKSAIAQSFIACDFIVLCFVVVEDVERE